MAKIKEHRDSPIRFKVRQAIYGFDAWVTIGGWEIYKTSFSVRDPKLALDLLEESFAKEMRELLLVGI